MKKNLLTRIVCIASLVTASVAVAQQPIIALPMVSSAEVPLYPPGARHANIEGVVRVKVTTDGHNVISAAAEKDSNQVLARAAERNAKTWQFTVHEPTTFTVIYRYKLVTDLEPKQNNPRVIMQLPTEVEVDALRWGGTVDLPAELNRKNPQADVTILHETQHAQGLEK